MKKTILLIASVFCLLIVNGQMTTSSGQPITVRVDSIKFIRLPVDTPTVRVVYRGRSPFTYSRCHCSTCGWYKGDKGKIDTTSIDPFRSYYIENLGEFYENEDSIGGIKTAFRSRHSLDSIYTEKFGGMVNKKVK